MQTEQPRTCWKVGCVTRSQEESPQTEVCSEYKGHSPKVTVTGDFNHGSLDGVMQVRG